MRRSDNEIEEYLDEHSFLYPQIKNAQDTLNETEARHDDIMKLEDSLRELHNILIDVFYFVELHVRHI